MLSGEEEVEDRTEYGLVCDRKICLCSNRSRARRREEDEKNGEERRGDGKRGEERRGRWVVLMEGFNIGVMGLNWGCKMNIEEVGHGVAGWMVVDGWKVGEERW